MERFSFSLVYHPGDCVVTLNALVPPYLVAGESTEALVGNCGPAGVTAKGAWVEAAAYVRNDLVTHEGSTWRARRNNAGRTPAGGADWEVFAAAGEAATAPDADGTARVEPTGPAGGDLAGTYPNPTIRLLSIGSAKLGNGVVITEKLATNAVTTAKILDDTIRSLDIFNGTILSQDIADGTITGIDIAINTITGDNIATNTILGGDIVNGTITGNDVGDGSLTGTDIADGSIAGIDLLDGTVATVDIADDAINSAKVLDDTAAGGGLCRRSRLKFGRHVRNRRRTGCRPPRSPTTRSIAARSSTTRSSPPISAASSVRASELGTITRRSATSAAIAPGAVGSALATCLAGERVITGGNDGSLTSDVVASRDEGNGWRVFVRNNGGGNTTVTTHAYCLQAS